MKSRNIQALRFVVKVNRSGFPVIVDLHNNARIVCGFNCFVVAYQHCNRLNRN